MENFSLPLRRKLVLKTYIDKKQVWERETIEIQGTLKIYYRHGKGKRLCSIHSEGLHNKTRAIQGKAL